jgi:hypothetical protein
MQETETQNVVNTEELVDTAIAENADSASDAVDNGSETAEGTSAQDTEAELKTVRKALEKRNRYNNNLRQRIRALEMEVEKARSEFSNKKTDAPDLEKFDSVLDFVDAKQNYTLEQKLAEQAHKAQIAALEQQQHMAFQQQAQEIHAQVQELLNSNPDYKNVITANAAVFDAMPPHIEQMLAEMDDAPAATYALAKEGRLQSLYSMPPQLAAAHLVQAEIRGQMLLQQSAQKAPVRQAQQTQQAPKPIGSLSGAGKSSSKSPEDMSPDQLMSWLKS